MWGMRQVLASLVFMILICSMPSIAQTRYFPPRSLDENLRGDEFLSQWYSAALQALDEPSLWERSKSQKEESYRFLWLRTFHHPVAVRIDIKADGSQLTVKMTSGAGGYHPGHLTKNASFKLTKAKTDNLLSEVKKDGFWQIESGRGGGGCDGADWILEGVRDGTYRVVVRWSPQNGPVRDLGLFMLEDLARLKIRADDID